MGAVTLITRNANLPLNRFTGIVDLCDVVDGGKFLPRSHTLRYKRPKETYGAYLMRPFA